MADRNCEVNDDTRLCQCREGLKFNDAGKCVGKFYFCLYNYDCNK